MPRQGGTKCRFFFMNNFIIYICIYFCGGVADGNYRGFVDIR
ncbi:putative membrane protein [Gluconacetobacter diazotrophicus PA1 5]|uniref:Putative membrane protein n=1 Tax=Gluconacetobacter diazotrophicus (strain ATCC 49037 / DSM 5601 / CCUG 37298 / CIP 103539 / LMG 7603 / PAl5) TaxID=272568 RepID=A9HGD8_GLUDA|nr:putative membrane protein [Gluconacetobacter diazotrophicus PA1 5]